MSLPLMDEHSVAVDAPREAAWEAVERYAHELTGSKRGPIASALGIQPPSGFEVSRAVVGERLELSGQHRFARYRLAFALTEQPGRSLRLTAISYADFRGPHGRLYRTLLVRTGAHVWAVRRMLRVISRRASGEGEGVRA